MTEEKSNYEFSGKYIIKADLRCLTGLHIGGTDEGFEIGGMDNPVIKDPITGYPYIPGSSLKGKMRSLLEWANNKVNFKQENGKWKGKLCECGNCDICFIYGCSAATSVKEPTRLTIRDSFPKGLCEDNGKILPEEQRKGTIETWKTYLGEKIYTEVKSENVIDRLTSEAMPRSMERVPADSVFEVEMLFDLYKNDDIQKLKKVFEGMMLLEDSALGGSGSRGSGKVVFENIKIMKRSLAYYTKGVDELVVPVNDNCKNARDIYKSFDSLLKTIEGKDEKLSNKT
ncbi:MAG: type III-A CRISPR-associated RAMP protein Csm3 [Candidatus Brocadia sp. AMX2]|uniref:CRISPR system Cms endoribonuclease Csm3 n=1 Tax=Candidatus Brocadia sinica JPN1 TaxID=1197129 RepID=A0ABQ0JTH5_9BACT|nr:MULTISPECIES: type III-A CRISPR-associated RAMP protein Csm3 [Brocadia]MBC6931978.1 type III-A CRISPR-associated RAMP protein Csm3 [Candidatus Brocadia sp.]MBL1168258.1 type III-A CRISPR-associated RAMP protein Csm3 [Candidatus Brocadia sp. AMX1]NOG39969.1 type III-A CRISPR-associated RAMP protein Csm3 [Planctomycetota bacterium]NUQ57674.1 type III-A CRISPR-associated RAMP protein Csm3 [Candidatus Paceibacter sp.]GIK12857.1 MAG: type III-A CRISPR-associated RAMP protein Csm3 [Candidatus Bro